MPGVSGDFRGPAPRGRQGDRGPRGDRGQRPDLPVQRRARAAGGRPGPGQDAAGADARSAFVAGVPADPVHARPDARRHHRHEHRHGGPGDRPAGVPVPARADLRADHPGRRDQPGHAQDAVGHARSDAGALRHQRRAGPQAAGAVHGPGDAEPHRAGGHLSAARGPVGPLLLQAAGQLQQPRAAQGDPGPHDHRRRSRRPSRSPMRRRSSGPRSWSGGS